MLALDPDKFSVDSCIDHPRTKILPHFPKLSTPEDGAGGRKTMTGDSATHQARVMCGAAKKSDLTAYIGLSVSS